MVIGRLFATLAMLAFAAGGYAGAVDAQSAAQPTATSKYESAVADAKAAMLIDPNAALTKSIVAERYSATIPGATRRGIAVATARWLQGEARLRTNDSDGADVPIRQAAATVGRLEPRSKLQADVLLSLGWLDSNQGRVGNSLLDYQRAFEIYRALRDPRDQARALVFIALLYTQAMDQETAVKYYEQALDIYKSDVNMSVSIYNNRGLSFAQAHQYTQAGQQMRMALALAKQLDSRNLLQQIYINLARVELEIGNLEQADHAIAEARKVADPQDASLTVRLVATAAQSALQHHDLARARSLLDSVLPTINTKTTDRKSVV